MRLIFLRHAQSEANVQGLINSTLPGCDITAVGVSQAIKVGEELAKKYRVNALYASPFKRTMHTAELVNQSLFVPQIVPDIRLSEMYSGPYDGGPASAMLNAWEAYVEQVKDQEYLAQLGGSGESEFSFYDRLMSFLIELGARYSNETILVVTHQAPAEALFDMCDARTKPMDMGNTAYTEADVTPDHLRSLVRRRQDLAASLFKQI